jgi:DNA replication licensing factor MCM7
MAGLGAKKTKYPDYTKDEAVCVSFLKEYVSPTGEKKYWNMMEEIARRTRKVLEIDLKELESFAQDKEIANRMEKNARRYMEVWSKAVDHPDMPKANLAALQGEEDVMLQARIRQEQRLEDPTQIKPDNIGVPKELSRMYEIVFHARDVKTTAIRDIAASQIGQLIRLEGIVTRVTDVRPICKVATYTCDFCGKEIYQIIKGRSYTPLRICESEECTINKNKQAIFIQTAQSMFTKFQELKLQELPENVPVGTTPRSVTVYCFGETTRKCSCGDKVKIDGIWLPIPVKGFAAMRAGLTSNTYLEASRIIKEKKGYEISVQNKDVMKRVEDTIGDRDMYSKLSRSIAPEIYGLEDVKKAILLLLVAGVTKEYEDGVRIRGDINMLLMGDPGVAKSQLLKHITRVAPRCVYTTGKGSSGVGLTAAVTRDPVTDDMTLEGGALVLADTGICCIDEFDKMEEDDRTAIHEVMEQQTVSIAKAGITTTLNARTAILAAANPAFGRYNKRKSPEENVNLPAALLSRFDLMFVLIDKPDHDADIALARHITHVHQHNTFPKLDFEPYDSEFLRAYIAKARTYNPAIPVELTEYITQTYTQMRQECLGQDGLYNSKKIVMTPRGLLSILRLSQALARLEFNSVVTNNNIEEAIRLMHESKKSTKTDDDIQSDQRDIVSRIYDMVINHMLSRKEDEVALSKLEEILTVRGFTTEQINETIMRYDSINVWAVSRDRTMLRLV